MRRRQPMVMALAAGAVAVGWLVWSSGASVLVRPTPAAIERESAARGSHPAGRGRLGERAARQGAPSPSSAALALQEGSAVAFDFVRPPAAPTSYLELPREAPDDSVGSPGSARVGSDLQAAQGLEGLPAREQAALRLYASMGAAFEKLDGRCDLIGERVAELVDEQGTELQRPAVVGQTRESAGSVQLRDHAAAAGQVDRFRAQLRDTLGKCPGNQVLLGALRKLSLLVSS